MCLTAAGQSEHGFGESGRPFERVVSNLLTSAGTALTQDVLAAELAQILGRTAEHYTEVLPKFSY